MDQHPGELILVQPMVRVRLEQAEPLPNTLTLRLDLDLRLNRLDDVLDRSNITLDCLFLLLGRPLSVPLVLLAPQLLVPLGPF